MSPESSTPTISKPPQAPPQPAETAPSQELTLAQRERINIHDPAYPADMVVRHIQRYQWARDVIREQLGRAGAVLDCACGTGYGTKVLLEAAAAVVGVDKSPEAVKDARLQSRSSLVAFVQGDEHYLPAAEILGLGFRWYDAVACIESIEHMKEPAAFLVNAKKRLGKYGMLLLTTPVRPAAQPRGAAPANPYHVREYDEAELTALLERAGLHVFSIEEREGFFYAVACALPIQ